MSKERVYFKLEFPDVDPEYPADPEVRIHARHDGTFKPMTAKLVRSEIDQKIDYLKEELESVRKEAHRKYERAEKQLRR